MEDVLNKIKFVPNANTRYFSFYRTEGKVKGAFYPKNEKELVFIYNYLKINNIPFKTVGNGSNLLFSPKSEDFYIISLSQMPKKVKFKENKVYFSSSFPMPLLAQKCYQKSLSGLEELSAIPGTMGGIIKMNAGAFGKSIFDILDKVKMIKNGKVVTLTSNNLSHSYRKTEIVDEVILSGTIILEKSNKCSILRKQSILTTQRTQSQPNGYCCGSVFKNPCGESAGKLIEACGLKGISKNDAIISSKHANFIINQKNATFEDIYSLITLCEESVKNKFGIKLEREIEII